MSINLSSLSIEELNAEFEKWENTRYYRRRSAVLEEGSRRGFIHQRGRGFVTIASAASHFVENDPVCRRVRELLR